ncbi:Crp/Fnr family transcriptional regulator [Alkalicoccus daliensis]|uniref:CRP/FNR family transcriptional regulator, anaerobic regulatory protein n=1 Tax=Alkalicoccus daliensis TaxID=745820 RepID=A0A1H0HQP5_9BACI|nr:Crp/Fnr family transcriptional regulator [Alkalicoccus daliensis]SDO21535.1 CRP/FNR family transcriptional regulator, anaerobic regulatory protein [Alkalicoccus daliensis]
MGKEAMLEVPKKPCQNTFHFSGESMQELHQLMSIQTFTAGGMLFNREDTAGYLFYIMDGEVKIYKETADDKEYVLSFMSTGDIFGELNSFTQHRYHFNAVAEIESKIGVICNKRLEERMEQNPRLSGEFLKWSSMMEQIARAKLQDLTFYGKKGAVCSTLIRLVNSYGRQEGSVVKIKKKLKNGELGSYIGSSRENVNRILASLKKEGVISQEEGCLVINDLEYLKQASHCENCLPSICRM